MNEAGTGSVVSGSVGGNPSLQRFHTNTADTPHLRVHLLLQITRRVAILPQHPALLAVGAARQDYPGKCESRALQAPHEYIP
jgi:hypothetical protein